MTSIQVFSQPLGDFATNAYLLVSHNEAIAIDAPPGACNFYKNLCEQHGFSLKYLLLTHSHFDHIAEAELVQKLGAKVGIHPLDEANCIKPGSDGLPLMMKVIPFQPDFLFKDDHLKLNGLDFDILHTPGHTPGGVCFMVDNFMFSGDTLFKGSIGNLSFTTGDPWLMKESLLKLLEIKKNYIIYPGHGPKTELDLERKTLKYFISQIG